MNPDTGHLIRLNENMEPPFPPGYIEVPKQHRREADRRLTGREEVTVDMKKKSPLIDWAKRKKKARMAKESRRRNRT